MSFSSNSERELFPAIYHAYHLHYLPCLFLLSLYTEHIKQSQTLHLSIPMVQPNWNIRNRAVKTCKRKKFSLGAWKTDNSFSFPKFTLQPQWLWGPDLRTIQLSFKAFFTYIICQPAAFYMPTPPHKQTLWKVLPCSNRARFPLLLVNESDCKQMRRLQRSCRAFLCFQTGVCTQLYLFLRNAFLKASCSHVTLSQHGDWCCYKRLRAVSILLGRVIHCGSATASLS